MASFEELVEAALLAPVEGWDFSWLDGRATEERPPWGYAGVAGQRAKDVASLLDLQTGGGELLSALPALPRLAVATERWGPNVSRAATLLGRRVSVVECDDRELPFGDRSFELVLSRHPVATWWSEVARVLTPGGRYLSQQVGPGSMVELTEFLMGPRGAPSSRHPEDAARGAEAAGLHVEHLQPARLEATFSDVGAVVYFLRLVIWIVPDFTVERYRDRLLALHEQIEADGQFVAHATRFLIEATKKRGGAS